MVNSQSEIALLRHRIDQEVSALARLKHGFSSVSSHELISRRFSFLDACIVDLSQHVGSNAAIDEVSKKLDNTL